jgi:hypothetical protein
MRSSAQAVRARKLADADRRMPDERPAVFRQRGPLAAELSVKAPSSCDPSSEATGCFNIGKRSSRPNSGTLQFIRTVMMRSQVIVNHNSRWARQLQFSVAALIRADGAGIGPGRGLPSVLARTPKLTWMRSPDGYRLQWNIVVKPSQVTPAVQSTRRRAAQGAVLRHRKRDRS